MAAEFKNKINLKKEELNQLDEKIHELQVRVGNGIFSIERCTINLTRTVSIFFQFEIIEHCSVLMKRLIRTFACMFLQGVHKRRT